MIVHLHDYDFSYDPAMPVLEIRIGRNASDLPITLTAIMDTGADATIVPIQYIRRLRSRRRRLKWLLSVTGERYQVGVFPLAVQIGITRPLYLDVVGSERIDEIIVGRDVLNQYIITLNALGGFVEVSS
jgi:hypothetical protein